MKYLIDNGANATINAERQDGTWLPKTALIQATQEGITIVDLK